jgi:hypothetical protein
MVNLSIGFEMQCVNGARLVLFDTQTTTSQTTTLYYPKTRHRVKISPQIVLYADRLSTEAKKTALVKVYNTLAPRLKDFSLSSTTSPETYRLSAPHLLDILHNEMEAVVTYRTPRQVSQEPRAIIDFLFERLATAATSLIEMYETQHVATYALRPSMAIPHLDISAISVLTNATPTRHGVAVLLPRKIPVTYFKVDLLFNCQMTLGIPLDDMCHVILTLCDMYLRCASRGADKYFHPDEVGMVGMVKDLIESIRRDAQVGGQFENIVFVLAYIIRTRGNRKGAPFLVRHFSKNIVSKITHNDPTQIRLITRMVDLYTDGQASQYITRTPPVQDYDASSEYQNLTQSALYDLQASVSEMSLLVEFRYLSHILGYMHSSPVQNAQSLSHLSRVERLKKKVL